MKKFGLLIAFLILFSRFSLPQNAWINEFHYDNTSTDAGEFVEVVIENSGSYTLSDFQINLYNGGTGTSYNSQTVDNITFGSTEGNYTFYYWDLPSNGLQNGSPDGLSLSYQGTLISGQFLSYEGTFDATDGPANGTTSTDVGVLEAGTDPVGYSLQLGGTGTQYSDFTWNSPAAETKGTINTGQIFGASSTPTLAVDPASLTGFTYFEGAGPSESKNYTLSGSNLTPADSTIIVAGSTNFEVSTNNTTFSDTIKIDYTGGTLADTIIYVRLKADLAVDVYDETISNIGGGADEQLVSVSGSVAPLTALYVTPASLTNFSYLAGEGPSIIKSYTLSGQNLTPEDNTIIVASPTNYEVSNDSINFNDTLKIDYTGGSLIDTKIYVRLREGLSVGVYNGEKIVNSGGGAQDINVTLNGYVTFLTPIDSLKMNDANGITKAVNDTINTTGIVTSILQLGTGTSGPGTIQNENTAVAVYGNSFTKTPNLQIGDSVVIYNWKVVNFNGLTELSYISGSSVEIVSSGHNIEPLVVTIPEIKNQAWDGFEKYESMLLQINNVKFVQTGVFDLGTSTSGNNYQIFSGVDTLDFRIVKTNTSLLGKSIPTSECNIVGILQQYKTTAPYNAGYQILPLDSSGIKILTGVNENKDNFVKTYQLEQNYPNPFNPSTKIRFSIPAAGNVKLTVYNILGEKVQTLLNEEMTAGTHSVDFIASNLGSGIFLYRIESGSFTQTKKMTLLK